LPKQKSQPKSSSKNPPTQNLSAQLQQQQQQLVQLQAQIAQLTSAMTMVFIKKLYYKILLNLPWKKCNKSKCQEYYRTWDDK
jgi:hypothetical protein